MPRTRPPYPAEFRQQIIELARAGRTPAQLSREFGCTAQTIANWIGAARRDTRLAVVSQHVVPIETEACDGRFA